MKDIKTIDSLYHACTYGRAPVVFERGRGARLWDDKGRDYIDFGSGIGVMSLGYANPEWVKAVSEQAAVLPHTSNLFYNEKTAMLAGRLALRTHFERVFLSNSGAEANECLIKTARKWASDTKGEGEHPFVTLVNSFHGRTLTPVTATSSSGPSRRDSATCPRATLPHSKGSLTPRTAPPFSSRSFRAKAACARSTRTT